MRWGSSSRSSRPSRGVATLPPDQRPAYVGTFHGLGRRWGAPTAGDDDSEFWERRLPRLMVEIADGLPAQQRFDAIVVDEAQDLSPMQCRALARRVPTGSVTVLGDLAQATTPWAPGAWPVTLAALGHPDAHLRPLTVGYRVPGSVLHVTNRLLPLLATGLSPASSLRDSPDALRVARAADLAAGDALVVETPGGGGWGTAAP